MSKNIKIGNTTYQNVETIKVTNADNPSEQVTFEEFVYGYGYKLVAPTQETCYINSGFQTGSSNTTVSLPMLLVCGASNIAFTLTVMFNDGTSRVLSTSDTFQISYEIPSNLVSALSLAYNKVVVDFEYKASFTNSLPSGYGQQSYTNAWSKTINLYNGSTKLTTWTKWGGKFVQSTSSTSTIEKYIVVNNWKLSVNGIEQQNVYGLKIEGTSYVGTFGYADIGMGLNPTTKTVSALNTAQRVSSQKIKDVSHTGYFFINGLVPLNTNNNITGHLIDLPTIQLTYTALN